MPKIYIHVVGNTLGCHEKILKKLRLTKTGSKPEESDVVIVFCPIVSRYETDVNAALSSLPELSLEKKVLVAMHHTFDPDYPLPSREDTREAILYVDCLFHQSKGLLRCACNTKAIDAIRDELHLRRCC